MLGKIHRGIFELRVYFSLQIYDKVHIHMWLRMIIFRKYIIISLGKSIQFSENNNIVI